MLSKSLCKNLKSDRKILKNRISFFLCTNINRTTKCKFVVFGKITKPRYLRQFLTDMFVKYYSSQRAWLTVEIYKNWLLIWNFYLLQMSSKILLVVDNFLSYKIDVDLLSIEF